MAKVAQEELDTVVDPEVALPPPPPPPLTRCPPCGPVSWSQNLTKILSASWSLPGTCPDGERSERI